MKKKLTPKENQIIYDVFFHILELLAPKPSQDLSSLRTLIIDENWDEVFKNETILSCLRKVILDVRSPRNLFKKDLNILLKYSSDEIAEICEELEIYCS